MRGGAQGAPLGVGAKHHAKTSRQTGEHATQPLHLLLVRPTFARKTGSPSQLPTSCTPTPLFVSVSEGEVGRWIVRRAETIYPQSYGFIQRGKSPQKLVVVVVVVVVVVGWGGAGGWEGITSVDQVRVDQSDLSPQLAELFLAARRHSSGHTLLRNVVRQCRPPQKKTKKHLCFHFYVVILMEKKKIPSWSGGTATIAASTAQSQSVFPPTVCQGLKVEERHSSLSSPSTNETDWFKIRSLSNNVFCWRLARWMCEISELK